MGHRRSTLLYLYVWIATSVAFALYAYLAEAHGRTPGAAAYPTWPLWIIGNLLGFGLGSLGASNRAFVGFLAPPSRAGEVFGLWGLMFKLAAIMTFPFAWMKDTAGTPAALLVLATFLIAGAIITLFVDEKRGHAAATANEPATVAKS